MRRERDLYEDSAPPRLDRSARYVIFDTETAGLPPYRGAPVDDTRAWPRLVQIAWLVCDGGGHTVRQECFIVRPDGFTIPPNAVRIHGITTDRAVCSGVPLQTALDAFRQEAARSSTVVAHNMAFDGGVVAAECVRSGVENPLSGMPLICTMEASVKVCGIRRPGGLKWPTLMELHRTLFGSIYSGAHDAGNDAAACARCFFELKRRGIIR
ncbi:3'-5' exonuclease [Methanoculleus sp. 7T]|jgi:DNA polymerase-3 subunit epsilon|uniref:3'-5' exonuclease n=1 Tax=Methanoculleus sp. 7T TaxID=2937282 RepID=UPI0020BF30F5|nr:3'-5' exonuclease [Methanoculleus sp. 7T]MCK8517434.1 3'-5' exonuclease [Methanoculleus sp. 7T]